MRTGCSSFSRHVRSLEISLCDQCHSVKIHQEKKTPSVRLFYTVSLWEDCKFFSISIIRFLSLRRNDGIRMCHRTYLSTIGRRIPSSLLSFWLTLKGTEHVKHRDFLNQIYNSISMDISLQVTYNCGSLSFDYMPLQNTLCIVSEKRNSAKISTDLINERTLL